MSVDEEDNSIPLHGEDDFAAMRKAGRLAAEILDYITPFIVPGARTGACLPTAGATHS